ncbi:DUF3078 domain-containing protein [bacterium]|nr:DUF3078 domain-containing protein [bacterium]
MKPAAISIALYCLCSGIITAQEPADSAAYGWKRQMTGGISLSQTGIDNWKQGGENSLAWQMTLNFNFTRTAKRTVWANSGTLRYGITKTGEQKARKSLDEIKLESLFSLRTGSAISPCAAVTGETQFAAGYAYSGDTRTQVSAFLDPGYFRESVGLQMQINTGCATRLGAALKQTLTNDYPVPYADDPTTADIEKTKHEFGLESVTDITLALLKTMSVVSKLELFSTLSRFDDTDVRWDNVLTAEVAPYITVNLNLKLVYDSDISAKRQLLQSLAIGISYNIF